MAKLTPTTGRTTMIDDFTSVAGWKAIASGEATLGISSVDSPPGKAMLLAFDFHGGGGFAVARKEVKTTLPDIFTIRFKLRGEAPVNHFEIKLVDESGSNVWWHQWKDVAFPVSAEEWVVRSRELVFAWGPAGGGTVSKVGAIEFAITAGEGGRGKVWISEFTLEDRTLAEPPLVVASSHQANHGPEQVFMPGGKGWRTRRRSKEWLSVDFQQCHEYGGLVVTWLKGMAARDIDVEASDDGEKWTCLKSIRDAEAAQSFIALPHGESRHLRLKLGRAQNTRGFGIQRIEMLPFDVSRSPEAFLTYIAKAAPLGHYPRYLAGQQSYWTPVGTPLGAPQSLINEEGLVELQPGSCSVEPFLFHDGKLITWADAAVTAGLTHSFLPIPAVRWDAGDIVLTVTACALDKESGRVLHLRYHVENISSRPLNCRFFIAVRPFQVTPPWQKFKTFGGTADTKKISLSNANAALNDSLNLTLDPEAHEAGAAVFHHGDISTYLSKGEVPHRSIVEDPDALASAAWAWDLELTPAESREIHVTSPSSALTCSTAFTQAADVWRSRLGSTHIQLRTPAERFAYSFKTSAAHILLNRDGAGFQPGPRRYTRSWIRDGAMMGAALLRAGSSDEMRDFIRWYATYQAESGAVPCCVDEDGADWLVEHDSHGQLVFAVAEYVRFTGDVAFLRELWPAMQKALAHLQELLISNSSDEGLLPESASHEGYLAHPVHAYWDDFWALRAFQDAADMAVKLGEDPTRYTATANDLTVSIRASIDKVMKGRELSTMPGSVEWADFDPTATSNAVALLDLHHLMPAEALAATYRLYLDGWRRRLSGEMEWANYTAYEVRIVGALVRLGWREEACELLRFLVGDQRPQAWHQWPEISWRDPRSPGHLGDVPHSWISAEFMLSFRDMLAHEHLADNTLVIAAGVALEWLDDDGVRVHHLPTYFGLISYTLKRIDAETLSFKLEPIWTTAPSAIIVKPPVPAAIQWIVAHTGTVDRFTGEEFVLMPTACDISIHCPTTLLA